MQRRAPIYDKAQDGHYNLISALHKTIRGSDPDAALYYFARMLDAGEDPLFLGRRLVRMAVEDIGLADPQALVDRQRGQGRLRVPRLARGRAGARQGRRSISRRRRNRTPPTRPTRRRAAVAKERGSLMPPKTILNAPTKLMKGGLRRGLRLRPRRAGRLLGPELLAGGARPAALLRSDRARLRARDQEAAGVVGEAAPRARRGGGRRLGMIPKSGYRFSEKIMLKQRGRAG